MFEKDAKKYVNEHSEYNETFDMVFVNCDTEKAFKDGAEFDHNKANEWHYVKDRDYPKEKGNYLVAWKRTHHVEEYGEWGFDVDLFNADEGYFECVGDYVIAWKEIVLPKESE